MLVTVWVFIGIEGAVIFSGRAKKHSEVSKATFLGFFTVLAIYLLVSVLSLGVMTRPELANLGQPAMASLLEYIVGPWGAILVNIGVIVAIAGAWLAWTMFAFELPFKAAQKGTFPAIFAKENKRGVPYLSLLITNILVQIFIFTFLISDNAYNFAFSLASSTILIPYAFTAFYQLKHSLSEKKENNKNRTWNIIVGVIASIYAIWLVYAAGLDYLLLTAIIYAAGIFVYIWARLSHKKNPFTMWELLIALVLIGLAVLAIYELATGQISI